MIVRTDQADFVGHRFGSEAFQGLDIGGSDQAGDHVAPPLTAPTTVVLPEAGPAGLPSPRLLRRLSSTFRQVRDHRPLNRGLRVLRCLRTSDETLRAVDICVSLLGTPSGGKPEDGAGAVPAGGFALRSRAASGIRPAGTMTGLRGARWTGTGSRRATPVEACVPGSA